MSRTETTKARKTPWLRFALAMLLSVAIVLALCWKTETRLSHVFGKIASVDPLYLGIAFVMSAAVHILLGAFKWLVILRGMGVRTTFAEALFVRMGSDPLRAALPFKSGELGNVAYYWRTGRLSFSESVSWVAFDKAVNIGGTFFWLAVGLLILVFHAIPEALRSQTKYVAIGAALVAASTVALFAPLLSARFRYALVFLAGKAGGKVGRLAEGVLSSFARISLPRKAALVLLGVVFQLRPLLVCALLFIGFRGDFKRMPSPAEFLASGSIVVAFSNVPGPQWGAGPREAAMSLLFRRYVKTPATPAAAGDSGSGGQATLIAIGLLMGVAIHFAPAFVGLPFLAQFLNTLRTGQAPRLNGAADGEEETE